MKKRYSAYYRPEAEDLKKAGETALFVFDTNCLLDILRISPKLAEKTITTIKKYKGRIRIAAHSDYEYHKHLFEVPAQVLANVENVDRKLDFAPLKNAFEDQFKSNTGCEFPSDCLQQYVNSLKEVFDKIIKKDISRLKEHFEMNFTTHALQHEISQLLEDAVLPGLSDADMNWIKTEGPGRYEKKIPPGYEDSGKATDTDDYNRFGDLIIWKEILNLAKTEDKDIFFICRDGKEDWIARTAGKVLGPRIELLVEFKKVSPNRLFHIYRLTQFLDIFGEFEKTELASFPNDVVQPRRKHRFFGGELKIEDIPEIGRRKLFIPRGTTASTDIPEDKD